MPRLDRARRLLAGLPVLAALFVAAFHVPIPAAGNPSLERVLAEVDERLPGWEIAHASEAWEGVFTIVASCAGHDLAFQLVPGHGLPVGDHWVQSHDRSTRIRLASLSDYRSYMVWRAERLRDHSLPCGEELADRDPDQSGVD